jgi:hypothetical protein
VLDSRIENEDNKLMRIGDKSEDSAVFEEFVELDIGNWQTANGSHR